MRASQAFVAPMVLCVLVITGCAAHKLDLGTGLQLLQQRQFDEAHDALLAFAEAQPAHLFGYDFDLAEESYGAYRERYPEQSDPSVLRSLP